MKTSAQHLKRKKNVPILLLLLLTVLLLFIVAWQASLRQGADIPEKGMESLPESVSAEKNENSISIPGYEGIDLKADSLQQDVAFRNPAQNTCYFVMQLYLEDGSLLWESDYICPGELSAPMALTQALQKGTYSNAVLKYSCFKMDEEKTPLNGAEMKLTIRVK